MKILRFDSVGGASGDMILAALSDLGADIDILRPHLDSLGAAACRIEVTSISDGGFHGKRAEVRVETGPDDPHRHLADILASIKSSSLPAPVKELSSEVFTRLAEAEGRVHGIPPGKVHFHEAGAVDAVVDVTGACLLLHSLGIDAVDVGPLPLGSGTVQCEHGVLPVPAPATVELLAGHPVVRATEPFELVTPTGAAILTTWKEKKPLGAAGNACAMIVRSGCGFGGRKLTGRPNLLRALLLETDDAGIAGGDSCLVLECNLDDTVPELLGALAQKLMDGGALDAFTSAVQMKKQRPGTLLTVLCRPGDRDRFIDLIFRESTTFGIREHLTSRTTLERRFEQVDTPYGAVRIKIGRWKGADITRAPEHEDCARLARDRNVSVRVVYEAALQARPRN